MITTKKKEATPMPTREQFLSDPNRKTFAKSIIKTDAQGKQTELVKDGKNLRTKGEATADRVDIELLKEGRFEETQRGKEEATQLQQQQEQAQQEAFAEAERNIQERERGLNQPVQNRSEELAQIAIEDAIARQETDPIAGALPTSVVAKARALGLAVEEVFSRKTIAQAVDSLRIAFTGKKPLTIAQSQGTVTDLRASIKGQLETYKTFPTPEIEAEISGNLDRAQEAVLRAEKFHHSFFSSAGNLRSWTDGGSEIEADIQKMKTEVLTAQREFEFLKAEKRIQKTI